MSKKQGALPLAAADHAAKSCSTVGNPALDKVRVFQTPKGRQLAVVVENQSLRVFVEPLGSALARHHWSARKVYASSDTRNSNLKFEGCRLGLAFDADYLVFPDLTAFQRFLDWYKTL